MAADAAAGSGADSGADSGAGRVFATLLRRDLRLAARRRTDALLPVAFFVVAASLFPLGIGPEPGLLRQIAPGIVWTCALLAAMLSTAPLYAADLADGSLDQLLLAGGSALPVAAAKALVHWLLTGLPLTIVAPLLGVLFGMAPASIAALAASLLLGTPVLSVLGGLGAALTLGIRNGGVLLVLIVLPLAIPVLIFGSGAVVAIDSGVSARGHFSLLGALLIATTLAAPFATAAAIRIATE